QLAAGERAEESSTMTKREIERLFHVLLRGYRGRKPGQRYTQQDVIEWKQLHDAGWGFPKIARQCRPEEHQKNPKAAADAVRQAVHSLGRKGSFRKKGET